MTKTKLKNVNWHSDNFGIAEISPALKRFQRHLENNGLRQSTIEMYVFRVGKYLEFANSNTPSREDFIKFHEVLNDRQLSRSTINNYLFPMRRYHE
jgi:hypothetical protein